jgi:hypothetical protein
MSVEEKGEPEVCEYSKPAYQGAQYLRTCGGDYATYPYHCTESGWKTHFKECPIRNQLLELQTPVPEQEKPVGPLQFKVWRPEQNV